VNASGVPDDDPARRPPGGRTGFLLGLQRVEVTRVNSAIDFDTIEGEP
jgi:hypothetical protein